MDATGVVIVATSRRPARRCPSRQLYTQDDLPKLVPSCIEIAAYHGFPSAEHRGLSCNPFLRYRLHRRLGSLKRLEKTVGLILLVPVPVPGTDTGAEFCRGQAISSVGVRPLLSGPGQVTGFFEGNNQ